MVAAMSWESLFHLAQLATAGFAHHSRLHHSLPLEMKTHLNIRNCVQETKTQMNMGSHMANLVEPTILQLSLGDVRTKSPGAISLTLARSHLTQGQGRVSSFSVEQSHTEVRATTSTTTLQPRIQISQADRHTTMYSGYGLDSPMTA